MTLTRYRSRMGMPSHRVSILSVVIPGLVLIPATGMTIIGLVASVPVLWSIGLVWCVVAAGLVLLFWTLKRRYDRVQSLEHDGVPGHATVLAATRTKTRAGQSGHSRVYRMLLRMELDGMEPYELDKRMVPMVSIVLLAPGTTWPIRVDRDDPTTIWVDWEQLRASSGITFRFGPEGILIEPPSSARDGTEE